VKPLEVIGNVCLVFLLGEEFWEGALIANNGTGLEIYIEFRLS
jgi:hypothetical protein